VSRVRNVARKIVATAILLSYLASVAGPGQGAVLCFSGRCAAAESAPCECSGCHDLPSTGLSLESADPLGVEPYLPAHAPCECCVDIPLDPPGSHPNGKVNAAPRLAPLLLAVAAAVLPQADSCPPVCSALSPPRVPPHLPSLRTVVLLI